MGLVVEADTKCATNRITNVKTITKQELLARAPKFIKRICGMMEWFSNGLLHSYDDKPTVIGIFGNLWWFKDGRLHRDNDKPAVVNGHYNAWYKNGKLHRDDDKPAVADDY